MAMKIEPNKPLTCKYLGVPAEYQPYYKGGYEVRFKICDIPLEGHELSSLRKQALNDGYGEANLFVDNLDDGSIITDIEPIYDWIEGEHIPCVDCECK